MAMVRAVDKPARMLGIEMRRQAQVTLGAAVVSIIFGIGVELLV
jgi:hypothetical protein